MNDNAILGYLIFDEESGGFVVNIGCHVDIYKTEQEADKSVKMRQEHSDLKGHGRKYAYIAVKYAK